jgi:hypothetical protein
VAAAKRKPGSDLGRPALDWEQAFAFYASLSPERRSYRAVAAEFGVSRRTVETHGRRDRWRERVARIEAEAALEAAKRLGRARADQLADVQKLIEASFITYAQQLRSGEVRLTASDLPRLVKLLHELWGEPVSSGPLSPSPTAGSARSSSPSSWRARRASRSAQGSGSARPATATFVSPSSRTSTESARRSAV